MMTPKSFELLFYNFFASKGIASINLALLRVSSFRIIPLKVQIFLQQDSKMVGKLPRKKYLAY